MIRTRAAPIRQQGIAEHFRLNPACSAVRCLTLPGSPPPPGQPSGRGSQRSLLAGSAGVDEAGLAPPALRLQPGAPDMG